MDGCDRSGLVLLEVKDGLIPNNTENQQSSMLKDWNASDENPCNWTGITCHPHHFTVRSMSVLSSVIIFLFLNIFFLTGQFFSLYFGPLVISAIYLICYLTVPFHLVSENYLSSTDCEFSHLFLILFVYLSALVHHDPSQGSGCAYA